MIMASILTILSPLMLIIYVGIYIYIILLIGRLVRAVEKIASKIVSMGPLAVKASIEAINAAYEQPRLEHGLRREASLFGAICATDDAKEGTGAFLAKRKATFKGE